MLDSLLFDTAPHVYVGAFVMRGVCYLYAAELPYAPVIQSVALSRDESRAIVLTWQPGFDGNSPIIKFTVEYQAVPEGKDLKHATNVS